MNEVYRDVSISVGQDGNNNVELTIWTDMLREEVVRISLSPGRAATLLRDLANQTTYALTGSALSIARGDCTTCRNTRMVMEPTSGGREQRVHCPDCKLPDRRDGYPPRPQIGGGMA